MFLRILKRYVNIWDSSMKIVMYDIYVGNKEQFISSDSQNIFIKWKIENISSINNSI